MGFAHQLFGKNLLRSEPICASHRAFQTVIGLEPTDGDHFVDLADCYYFQDEPDYTKAEKAYKQAVEVGCYYSKAYVYSRLSDVLRAQEKYQLAVRQANKAIEADDSFAPAYFSLGLASYFQDNKESEAIEVLEKAVELNPESSRYCYWLGEVYRYVGENELAEIYFETALELDPENESALEGLASVRKSKDEGVVGSIIKGIFG